MEYILKIEEATFGEGKWEQYDGFLITTNVQTIKVGISNGQSCCENWGYFMTNDNPEEFIGQDLLRVDIVDTCLNKEKMEGLCYEGSCMFVNFETSNGTLQFTVYNEHNGYYGHEAVVISNQLNVSETV